MTPSTTQSQSHSLTPMTLARAAMSSSREGRDQRTSGERWVRVLSLAAFTVSTWMLLTLAGGTWMFVGRHRNPGEVLQAASEELHGPQGIPYIFLALFASLLLIPTLLNLLTQAARANLSGRETHLATLRLLGANAGQVRGMMIVDALRQAAIGLVLGTVLYAVTVPVWSLIAFQGEQIGRWEMLTWWLIPVVWLVVLALAAASVWLALRRVSITPLGVSKRVPPKGQNLVTFVLSFVITWALLKMLSRFGLSPSADTGVYLGVLVFGAAFMLANAVFAVGLIQLVARLSYRVPGSKNYVATRRVGRDAKTTWRRVAALFFLAFTAGFASRLSLVETEFESVAVDMYTADIPTGVAITVTFGIVLLCVSTLLGQALAVVEQKYLTRSLYFIGAPASFHTAVAVREIGIPMAIVSFIGLIQGGLMGTVMSVEQPNTMTSLIQFVALVAIALIVSVAAVYATGPLRQRVLAQTGRLND